MQLFRLVFFFFSQNRGEERENHPPGPARSVFCKQNEIFPFQLFYLSYPYFLSFSLNKFLCEKNVVSESILLIKMLAKVIPLLLTVAIDGIQFHLRIIFFFWKPFFLKLQNNLMVNTFYSRSSSTTCLNTF